jgi:hypothetical protein
VAHDPKVLGPTITGSPLTNDLYHDLPSLRSRLRSQQSPVHSFTASREIEPIWSNTLLGERLEEFDCPGDATGNCHNKRKLPLRRESCALEDRGPLAARPW